MASKNGFAPELVELTIDEGDSDPEELKLVLKPGKTIKARLRDQNGDPVDRSDHVGIEPLVTVVSKLRFKSKKRPALVRR